jgi:hypothetical protein
MIVLVKIKSVTARSRFDIEGEEDVRMECDIYFVSSGCKKNVLRLRFYSL